MSCVGIDHKHIRLEICGNARICSKHGHFIAFFGKLNTGIQRAGQIIRKDQQFIIHITHTKSSMNPSSSNCSSYGSLRISISGIDFNDSARGSETSNSFSESVSWILAILAFA